jgi:hypothetical protein
MKNAMISFLMICFVLTTIQAQNQNAESNNKKVVIKKVKIENVNGKDIRTETIDTLDAAVWMEQDADGGQREIIIENVEGLEFDSDSESSGMMVPGNFKIQLDKEIEKVLPPNKAVLGVQLRSVDGSNGAQVIEVIKGSAAEKAGLQEGDIILSIAGKATMDVESVINALSNNKPGDTKIKNVKATLQERKEEVLLMKSCSPGMSMMKCCKAGDAKCCKKGEMKMCKDKESQSMIRIHKEMKEGGEMKDGDKKVIIIKKMKGDENKEDGKTEDMEIEIIRKNDGSQEIIESKTMKSEKQSLNVEYLTSSPNPSNGQMKIRFSGMAVPTTIQVLDLNGKEVYSEKLNEFDGTYNKDIDIKNEARGTMILKIIQGDKIMTHKIIVE